MHTMIELHNNVFPCYICIRNKPTRKLYSASGTRGEDVPRAQEDAKGCLLDEEKNTEVFGVSGNWGPCVLHGLLSLGCQIWHD